MCRIIERLETIGLGDRIWIAAVTVTCSRADAGYGALSPRSLRWWVAVWNRAVRPPPSRSPKLSPLRSLCCWTRSRSTSIRMAEPAESHRQRLPAMTSRGRCGRDRWRSPALRTCRTLPSLPGVKRASSTTRTPKPGALYKYHLERLDWVDEMVATHGLRRALSAADLEAAHNAGQPAIVGDVEGLDFLEKKLERLEQAHQRGVRHVQLVHYTPNDIGDFQTGAITHRGL